MIQWDERAGDHARGNLARAAASHQSTAALAARPQETDIKRNNNMKLGIESSPEVNIANRKNQSSTVRAGSASNLTAAITASRRFGRRSFSGLSMRLWRQDHGKIGLFQRAQVRNDFVDVIR